MIDQRNQADRFTIGAKTLIALHGINQANAVLRVGQMVNSKYIDIKNLNFFCEDYLCGKNGFERATFIKALEECLDNKL